MNSAIINFYSQNKVAAAGGVDSDAQAFFSAAGITDATQKSAVDTLVKSLKSNNIWSKMLFIYPFVGGTANSHKYNLKDPRDLDAAFRLSFSGTYTHDANGIQGGSSGYANTFFIPSSHFSGSYPAMSFYVNDQQTGSGALYDAGVSSDNNWEMVIKSSDNNAYLRFDVNSYMIYAQSDSLGFTTFMVNQGQSKRQIIEGATVLKEDTTTTISKPNKALWLGTLNFDGSATTRSGRRYAFVSLANDLSSADISNLNTAVQTYQTTLGRNV